MGILKDLYGIEPGDDVPLHILNQIRKDQESGRIDKMQNFQRVENEEKTDETSIEGKVDHKIAKPARSTGNAASKGKKPRGASKPVRRPKRDDE